MLANKERILAAADGSDVDDYAAADGGATTGRDDWRRAAPSTVSANAAALSVEMLEAAELLWRLSEFLALEPLTLAKLRSIVAWPGEECPGTDSACARAAAGWAEVNGLFTALVSRLPEDEEPERYEHMSDDEAQEEEEDHDELSDRADTTNVEAVAAAAQAPSARDAPWVQEIVDHTAGWV